MGAARRWRRARGAPRSAAECDEAQEVVGESEERRAAQDLAQAAHGQAVEPAMRLGVGVEAKGLHDPGKHADSVARAKEAAAGDQARVQDEVAARVSRGCRPRPRGAVWSPTPENARDTRCGKKEVASMR